MQEDQKDIYPEKADLISKMVQTKIGLLTKLGNHEHNQQVWQSGVGELVVARRGKEVEAKKAGPCPKCYLWMHENALARHIQKQCDVQQIRELERQIAGSHSTVSQGNADAVYTVSQQPNLDIGIRAYQERYLSQLV